MAKKRYRVETDSLGEVKIPFNALWGPQTQRAVDNFLPSTSLIEASKKYFFNTLLFKIFADKLIVSTNETPERTNRELIYENLPNSLFKTISPNRGILRRVLST